jgi:16S rRNA (cytosine1402-N4)-methyltransferase
MHVPVLVQEVVAALEPARGGTFVDCTVGLGGHAEAILDAAPGTRVIGIDRDARALALAAARLDRFGDRARLVEGEFGDVEEILASMGVAAVAGVLADLGVSSLQLDTPERGFSFRFEGPLDMRMGAGEVTAADIVNHYSEAQLETILREYGEEPQARRIARAIVEEREKAPIETTETLAELVRRVKGRQRGERRRIDPATRAFQALRLEVNQELAGLEKLLARVIGLLERDGRLVVISYHSLEDRIVKHTLRGLSRGEKDPVTGRTLSESRAIELLTRKPVRPTESEVAANPRARSARLRAARRL